MIIAYTIPKTCPNCKALVEQLQYRCIPFQEKDLRELLEDAEAMTDLHMQGVSFRSAPVVCDGGRWVQGKEIEEWLHERSAGTN